VRCNERKSTCIDSRRGEKKEASEFEKWGA
jgi:hypothetical protein